MTTIISPDALKQRAPASAIGVFARGDGFPRIAKRVETTCPYCGVGCGIMLNISEEGKIVQVDDVPENLSSNGMLCVKGRYGVGYVHSPERLTTPLVRRKPGGELEPATWDEALDLVATEFAKRIGKIGVVGSAKTTNEDCYVMQKYARLVLGTNNIDHCARLCHSPSVVAMQEMMGTGATSNSYADYEKAGCLMVVGSDTDANHPVIAARVRKGVANGAKLIVVNPKRIRLCDVADLWLRLRPGTDVALFNGLARIALEEGLVDWDFVARRTEGFDAWRAYLEPYSPANVARVTGVPEPDLRAAARMFAKPEFSNSCMLWGMGITQHTRGTMNAQAMVNFVFLTGQVGKPGSGISPLRGQNNVQGCSDVGVLPNYLPGYQGFDPQTLGVFERAWGGPLPATPGWTLTEMMEAAINGEMTAFYLCGENPMLTEPNSEHARHGMEKLEFLVVQNILPNETLELAHVVLPAASFAEKDGTVINSERRVQRVRKAIEPPGQALPDWVITCEIAKRTLQKLGRPATGFDYRDPSEIFDELASLTPFLAGINYARLEHGGIQWPCPTPDHPGTPLLFSEEFPRGRGKFVPVDQGPLAAEMPDETWPLILNTGRVLEHWHGGDMTRQSPNLLGLYRHVEVSVHPDDATKYGLEDGALLRVVSRRGEMVGVTKVTTDVRAGEIFVPFVRLDESAANFLTNNVYDPRAKIPEYKVSAVRVERV